MRWWSKPTVWNLGVESQLVGVDFFFDEWKDPTLVSRSDVPIEALIGTFDVFWSLLGWQTPRCHCRCVVSTVVRSRRSLKHSDRCFILSKLDETPVPDVV